MKNRSKIKFTDYDNFIIMAFDTINMCPDYKTYLNYKKVLSFLNRVATATGDTFLYEETIYKKKIKSSEASTILDKLFKNKFDKRMRLVANQLGIKI
jgi:hypothetical protein